MRYYSDMDQVIDRRPKYSDYSSVDWSLNNHEIGRILGVDHTSIRDARRRRGIAPAFKRGNGTDHKAHCRKPNIDLDYIYCSKSSWRKGVIARSGQQCQICGYLKVPVKNHCHHIAPRSKGGVSSIRNGIMLCARCHEEVHAGLLECNPI